MRTVKAKGSGQRPRSRTAALGLSEPDRSELLRRSRSRRAVKSVADRARMVICRAEGLSWDEIAIRLGHSPRTVAKWVERYCEEGLAGLEDRPGRGRERHLPPEVVAKVVDLGKRCPRGAERWTTRLMAEHAGVSANTVSRIWREHGIVPPRSDVSRAGRDRTRSSRTPRADSVRQRPPGRAPTRSDESGGGVSSEQGGTESEPENRASLQSVSRIAGVSAMTVSRVLNDRPYVRTEVRERVLAAANQCNYRPDPELRKLMSNLRTRRVRRVQARLGMIVEAAQSSSHYRKELLSGARRRAEELGFALETVCLEELCENPQAVLRVLHNRGIEGLLLTPTANKQRFARVGRWAEFSVVAATYMVSSPEFDLVVHNHFRNMELICQALDDHGFQRIGLAIPKMIDELTHRHLSGSFGVFHLDSDRVMLPVLRHSNSADRKAEFKEWYERVHPDSIIVGSGEIAQWVVDRSGLAIPKSIPVVPALNRGPWPFGIDLVPNLMGSTASEVLARMLEHGQKGIPEHPTVTMVGGRFDGEIDRLL